MSEDPRLSEIRQIAVTVRDVDAALGFYRDIPGLEFLFRAGPDLAFLDAGGIRIMLSTPQGAGAVRANSILYYRVPAGPRRQPGWSHGREKMSIHGWRPPARKAPNNGMELTALSATADGEGSVP